MRRVRPWAAALALSAAVCGAGAGGAPARLQIHLSRAGDIGPATPALPLQVGTLSAAGAGRRAGIVVRERIAVRLEGPGSTARVSVALAEPRPGRSVRIDGQLLSTSPRVIDPMHRIGATVVHQLEVTIGPEAPAGVFMDQILWTADSD
jgi:hypothetical protein